MKLNTYLIAVTVATRQTPEIGPTERLATWPAAVKIGPTEPFSEAHSTSLLRAIERALPPGNVVEANIVANEYVGVVRAGDKGPTVVLGHNAQQQVVTQAISAISKTIAAAREQRFARLAQSRDLDIVDVGGYAGPGDDNIVWGESLSSDGTDRANTGGMSDTGNGFTAGTIRERG